MISVVMTSVVEVRKTGVLLCFFLVLVLMVLMVVGSGVPDVRSVSVLAVDDAGMELLWELVLELGLEIVLDLGLGLVVDETAEVARLELVLELELQSVDPQSCGVKL